MLVGYDRDVSAASQMQWTTNTDRLAAPAACGFDQVVTARKIRPRMLSDRERAAMIASRPRLRP
jgi:hypothetical protein